MKADLVELVTLERGGSVLVMPMAICGGEVLVHCDVQAFDDEDRFATIALTITEAEKIAHLLLSAVQASRSARVVRS